MSEPALRTLENIIVASTEALRPLLRDAFEAGRDMGRAEAAADLKAKIGDLLSANQNAIEAPPSLPSERATQGSVKPTIAKMIDESGEAGLSSEEITERTGFKHNTIRGTLWTLGHEGTIVRQGRRWYPKDKEPL